MLVISLYSYIVTAYKFISACNHNTTNMFSTSYIIISNLEPSYDYLETWFLTIEMHTHRAVLFGNWVCCNIQHQFLVFVKDYPSCTFIMACQNNAMNMSKSLWRTVEEIEPSCVYLGLLFGMHIQHAVFVGNWLCYKMKCLREDELRPSCGCLNYLVIDAYPACSHVEL